VREACSRLDIKLDVAGVAAGQPVARPEALLPSYDLVFAKGRAALEAMAVGAAVVLCDQSGAGPMVTTESFDRLRRSTSASGPCGNRWPSGVLEREIRRYDPADAAEVSRRVRAQAGLKAAVDRLAEIYEAVVAEHRERGPAPAGEEGRAAAAYLRWLDPQLPSAERFAGASPFGGGGGPCYPREGPRHSPGHRHPGGYGSGWCARPLLKLYLALRR